MNIFTMNLNLIFFFGSGGGGRVWREREGVEKVIFFRTRSKYKKNYFFVGGGGKMD